eukprot:280854-Pyramimonas_sp.AAC.1
MWWEGGEIKWEWDGGEGPARSAIVSARASADPRVCGFRLASEGEARTSSGQPVGAWKPRRERLRHPHATPHPSNGLASSYIQLLLLPLHCSLSQPHLLPGVLKCERPQRPRWPRMAPRGPRRAQDDLQYISRLRKLPQDGSQDAPRGPNN